LGAGLNSNVPGKMVRWITRKSPPFANAAKDGAPREGPEHELQQNYETR